MRRTKGRANGRRGLWQDTPAGLIPAGDLPPEAAANPLTVACTWPPCKAPIRRPCTDHRGRPRKPHPSRTEAANRPKEPPVPDIDDEPFDPGPPKEEPNCFACTDTGCVECDPTVEGPEAPLPPSSPHTDDPWGDPTSPF